MVHRAHVRRHEALAPTPGMRAPGARTVFAGWHYSTVAGIRLQAAESVSSQLILFLLDLPHLICGTLSQTVASGYILGCIYNFLYCTL